MTKGQKLVPDFQFVQATASATPHNWLPCTSVLQTNPPKLETTDRLHRASVVHPRWEKSLSDGNMPDARHSSRGQGRGTHRLVNCYPSCWQLGFYLGGKKKASHKKNHQNKQESNHKLEHHFKNKKFQKPYFRSYYIWVLLHASKTQPRPFTSSQTAF